MGNDISFGEWLEDRLKGRGWTQLAFADAIDVARSTVNNWINNYKRPRRRTCRLIAGILGVEENEVLVRAGYPPKDPDYVLPEHREERITEAETEHRFIFDYTDEELQQHFIEIAREMARREERRREGS